MRSFLFCVFLVAELIIYAEAGRCNEGGDCKVEVVIFSIKAA